LKNPRKRPYWAAVARVLVTGAAGHIGANLVRAFLLGDDPGAGSIRVLLRAGSNSSGVEGLDLERVEGDLRSAQDVRRAVEGCETIYHCGAKVSTERTGQRELFDSNVVGTRNVLRAAKDAGVRRVVVSGSLSAVGHRPDRPTDETVPFNPFAHVMPYAWTKALVELACWEAFASGLDVVVATSCAVLGPNDFIPSRMGKVLLDFAAGKLRAYIPGGFEFVGASDIVQGHILAMQKGRAGQKYIFASGHMSVDELMGVYEEITGRRRPPRLPAALVKGVARVTAPLMNRWFPGMQRFTPASVELLTMSRRADCSKAQGELGYRPTPLRPAIQDAYDHFVRRGLIRERPAPQRAVGVA
jgi:nucleoside-diphosphate-sugar epimerase